MSNAWVPPEPEDAYVDYGDAEPDPNADTTLLEARYRRSPPPTNRGASFDLLGLIRADREARAAAPFSVGGEVTLLHRVQGAVDSDVPPALERLVLGLAEGWDWRLQQTVVQVAALRYVGNTDEHSQGDLRTPEHRVAYYGVQAVLRAPAGVQAAFWATWVRKEMPGKKPGNAFESVVGWDPVQHQWFSAKSTELSDWLTIFAPSL